MSLLDAGGADSTVLYKSLPPPPDPVSTPGRARAGAWVNVTPSGVRLDPNYPSSDDNYGVLDVVVDPLRPSDSVCFQMLSRGLEVDRLRPYLEEGRHGDRREPHRQRAPVDGGDRPESPSRPDDAPLTIYTVDGYGNQLGVYKSTDGGVNWSYYAVNNTQGTKSSDVYSLDIDPYNSNHLIAGFHDVGMSESKDGGQTWATIPVPSILAFRSTCCSCRAARRRRRPGRGSLKRSGTRTTTECGERRTPELPGPRSRACSNTSTVSAQIYQDGHGATMCLAMPGRAGTSSAAPTTVRPGPPQSRAESPKMTSSRRRTTFTRPIRTRRRAITRSIFSARRRRTESIGPIGIRRPRPE